MPLNPANLVTSLRLLAAIAVLVLLGVCGANAVATESVLLDVALWLFIGAAITDVVDGMLARRLGCTTVFGRVVDPLVDKVLICGAVIVLAGPAWSVDGRAITGVEIWMVLVIVLRELTVSGLRALAESSSRDFGASLAGKVKMVVQCVAVGCLLGRLAIGFPGDKLTTDILLWVAVAVTAVSIYPYIRRSAVAAPPGTPSVARAGHKPDGRTLGPAGDPA